MNSDEIIDRAEKAITEREQNGNKGGFVRDKAFNDLWNHFYTIPSRTIKTLQKALDEILDTWSKYDNRPNS